MTVDEYYPMPTDRECIEYLAGGELFGSSDVSAMYWQLPLAPQSRHLTAFATEDGVWQFRRVPFGLKNAVASAQASMRKILRSDDRLRHVWNYIDDTFWATKGVDKYRDYLTIVDALFEVCAKFNIRLSSDKTVLGRETLNVLGHTVDKTGVRIDEGRKSALCNFKRPSDTKEVQAFMGATGYIRSFIPDFSTVAYPLTGMKKFVWKAEQEHAFTRMKELIRAADVLSNPDYSREFYLKGDASEKGCGAVLFQLGERGQKRVIAYASKKFCLRESKWRVMERELFSIIFGLQRFRCFVQGCSINVINDHKNLVWLRSNDTSSKLTRWSLVLEEVGIKSWSHAPGVDMGVEDGLSRGGGEDPSMIQPVGVMSERERILLEEEDIQLSALRALGERVTAACETSDGEGDDGSIFIDLEAQAEVLLSTLVAMRQAWVASKAATARPSEACQVAALADSGDEDTKRVGAKAARATQNFIAASEARRGSLRSQASSCGDAEDTDINARSVQERSDERSGRIAARAATVAAAAAAAVAAKAAAAAAATAASARAESKLKLAAESAARQARRTAAAARARSEGGASSSPSASGVATVDDRTEANASPSSSSPAVAPGGMAFNVACAEKTGARAAAAADAARAAPAALPPTQKEKESGLAAAAKAMLQQARRLATTARAVAADNIRWQQARKTDGPAAYDGQIRQREAQRAATSARGTAAHGVASQPAQEPRVLLEWSALSETRKKELFDGAHLFPHDHPGVIQTVKRLLGSGKFSLERGEYGRMFEDVTRWRRACPVCQMLQEARSQDAPVSAIPSRPFFDTSCDFLDIPADVEGHTCVCAVVDNFSGFSQLYPCKRKDAKTAVRCLLRTFADLGKPCTLRSDQGPSFENHVCNEFNRRMGITSYRTIPHHHQSNGVVEKVNGRAIRMLSACVLDPKCQPNVRAQWADVLPFVQLAINRTVHARTRVAPCSLIYGEGFLDLGRGLFDSEEDSNIFTTGDRLISSVSPDASYVAELAKSQAAVLTRAMQSHSEYLAKAMAGRQVVSSETYIPGQYVLVDFPSDESRTKLTPRWTGPFKVLQQSGTNTYTVLDSVRGESRDVASAQLVRFNWDWFEGAEGNETAMAEHARKLALLAPQTPKLTPLAVLAARTRKSKTSTPRMLDLEAGRGQLKLASCEFQVSFAEDATRLDWMSASQLEDEPVFHAFLNRIPSWREGGW